MAEAATVPGSPTDSSNNLTALAEDDHCRESIKAEYRITISVVVGALVVLTTFGNLLTIVAVRLDKRLRSISNFYIASLASADFLVGSVVMTFMLMYTISFDGVWVFGAVLCDIWTFFDYVSCTASLTNVCLIAADRYQTVASPLRAIRRRTKRRAQYMIAVAWLIPVFFWIIVIVLLRALNGRPPPNRCYLIWSPPIAAIVSASIIVYLPIAAILGLFIAMMCVLRQHMTSMAQRMRSGSNTYRREKSTSYSQCSEDTTSLRSGGISFNPRYSVDISLYALERKRSESRGLTVQMRSSSVEEQATGEDLSNNNSGAAAAGSSKSSEAQEFWLFSGTERRCRSVGTSTSPERYGLVRSVATNTSPVAAWRTSTAVQYHQQDGTTEVTLEPPPLQNTAGVQHVKSTKTADPAAEIIVSDPESESQTDAAERTASPRGTSADSAFSSDGSTARRWQRYASLLRAERQSSMERSRLKQQLRAAKTLGLIMGFLLLCWIPFSVMWPVSVFCPDCISQRSYDISFWTNYLNSSINPVIYCLCNQNFRKAFRRLLFRH